MLLILMFMIEQPGGVLGFFPPFFSLKNRISMIDLHAEMTDTQV